MPQQAPKLCKRPARKAPPLKGVLKNKQKTNNNKKTKLVIKKLVTVKAKGSPNKLLVKTTAPKADKPKIATKSQVKSSAKQTTKPSGDNKSDSSPSQKKKSPKSSEKAKPSDKGKSAEKKSPPKSKTVKGVIANKLKRAPPGKSTARPKKSKPAKDKSANGDSSKAAVKSPHKDSNTKSNVKKVADSAQPVSTVKKEKDRSRSPDKKRLGVTRSSSAPLIPSATNSDVVAKEHTKSLAINRNSKASLENISSCIQNTASTKSTSKKTPKASDTSKDSPPKSKECDSKNINKNAGDKLPSKGDSVDLNKSIKTVPWSDEFKSSDLINKTPFLSTPILSPLGKKKAVDIVRPIARVKGTIIEKRVDLEKRKLTPSPAKNIEEKVVSEKSLTIADKLKLELEKKKETCVSTKSSEDPKKVVNEKDHSKLVKSPKKMDLGKTTTEISKNIMVVQPDLSLNSSGNIAKCESDVNKPPKEKGKKVVTVKKVVSRPKLLSKNTKKVLKRIRPLTKKIVLVKKISVNQKITPAVDKESDNKESNTSITVKKLSEDSQKVPNLDADNKVDLKISKLEKCKLNVGKTTPLNRSKSKEIIPKKIKTEPKELEEGDIKKLSKKIDSNDTSGETVSSPKCASEESKTEVNLQHDTKSSSASPSIEKIGKGKTKKTDRSPSPNKSNKEKTREVNKIITDEIKKEKSSTDKSSNDEKSTSKSTDKNDVKKEDKNSNKTVHLSTKPTKKFISLPTADNRRRKKLLGFWTGPKRHREASLNALAKVQCLYENESRTHLELGLLKTVDKLSSRSKDSYRKRLIKVEKRDSTSSESEYETRVKSEVTSSEEDSNPPLPRTLRCQPRGAGKYWEMKISSSEESEVELKKKAFERRKFTPKPKVAVVKTEDSDTSTKTIHVKERRVGLPLKKRRKRAEITMDLKDMVVKKRMASLNASAILAASYEKRSPRSGRDETTSSELSTSSEQEEILAKKVKIQKANADRAEAASKEFAKNGDSKASTKSKVEVIVNQEADVTITGVYSTHHHEGFCTVSGMQYRISATSHTQTTATTSGDKELPPGSSSAGYTPLGALSSMHPPGGGAAPHLHQGPLIQDPRAPLVGSLGRRAGCSSAFSAPHHHSDSDRAVPGIFQPAGPMITATPLHGGFKDGGAPPPMSAEQPPQFSRYTYPQPQQVVPYGGAFGSHNQYSAHAHYGGGEVCYGPGRGPAGGLVLPALSCYRPTAAHCTPAYRHPPGGSGPAPGPPGPHDSQLSPAASDSYAPQYCPPCYQHPHTTPRAPIPCLDTSYQGPCPCPLQTCSKNVHTGPATGNPPAGGGPITSSPPGGSRAPIPPIINFCIDDKRKSKTSNGKDPPLLNQVLKNECSLKNGPDLRSTMFFNNPRSLQDNSNISGRSPKREYFSDQVNSRVRQEVNDSRGGCCAVAINPSLTLMPPEALGPPSPARGSAGASIPQPPDPPYPCVNNQSTPIPVNNPPQRRARVGKAMVRKSIGADDSGLQTQMLLMCQPRSIPIEINSPNSITSPLQIITEDINKESVNSTVKNEIDSGDEVILLDSPNSKIAPIDLSSSEENNADSKSDKSDCVIIRNDGPENVIDLSIDPKKEDSSPKTSLSTLSDDTPSKDNANKSALSSDSLKKSIDIKTKANVKRRLSQPKLEIDLDAQIADNLASNGIGEHVKLQKRQKIQTPVNNNFNKKTILSGSYKDLIKKPEKVFKLNNGKRQLNTLKSDKAKQLKTMSLIESDKHLKGENKKNVHKRKISPSPSRENMNKRKKLSTSLLKYTDKKKHKRPFDTLIANKSLDVVKNNITPLLPKNKNTMLLQNMISKNNNIESTLENDNKTTTENGHLASPTCNNSKSSSRVKKCDMNSEICPGKNRTVLNINNNVVKKVMESECIDVGAAAKNDNKLTPEKLAQRKSKSPASLNRKSEKIPIKNICNAKGKCQPSSEVKDTNTKVTKLKSGKTKKCKNRLIPIMKNVKKKTKLSEPNDNEIVELLPARRSSMPRWSNGWIWEGEAQQGKVYVNNEESWFMAHCYTGMRHERAGDSVRRGDCVLLRAGTRRTEAPFVAKVAQLWENPEDGEMMVSLLWYYRPEHTDCGRQPEDCAEEVFASRHRDANSVACIEDKCYVLTFNEYCRYRKQVKAAEENIVCSPSIVPSMPLNEITSAIATNDGKVPLNISPDLVLFCERVYDFRLKKIVRPPY